MVGFRGIALAMALTLIMVAAALYPATVPHAAHHASHHAATHGTVLCTWLCSAGQMAESPFVSDQAVILVAVTVPPVPLVSPDRLLSVPVSSRAPPAVGV